MVNTRLLTFWAFATLALTAQPLYAQDMNIDFGDFFAAPSSTYAAAANPGTWNELGTGVLAPLVDLSGVPTGATLTVTADVPAGADGTCGGDEEALFGDNFYSSPGNPWNVTITGLTNGQYTVFLYGPTNPSVTTGATTVNGTPVASISGDGCGLVPGTTYTSVAVTVNAGSLTINGADASYSGLGGLQLVFSPLAIPMLSPSVVALLALLMMGVGIAQLGRRATI